MKEFQITKNEAGQRLDKYLKKRLPLAGSSFLYKMLRKKNIVWNDKKADGSEKIMEGDVIQIYFSDETYEKFAGINQEQQKQKNDITSYEKIPYDKLDIIYEDEDIVIINKPSGMLSQKAEREDISANEYLISYLIHNQSITRQEMETFHPSICNRLDRNTSGLLLAGKSLRGLQELSEMLKKRTVKKYYRCIVAGQVCESSSLKGYLKKDEKNNQVAVYDEQIDDSKYIETSYKPIYSNENITLLEVHLITGRSHQIRAHLASIGHPILGDVKYGNPKVNAKWKKLCNIKSQMLHAYRMEFTDGRVFIAPVGSEFDRVIKVGKENSDNR